MDSLWGNLFKGERKQKEHIRELLKDIPVFKDLNTRELVEVERIMHRRHFDPDEVVFSQGSMGAGMYIVVEGTVHIVREENGSLLAELAEGEFFGEIALLDESPRTATAIARTPCTLMGFFQGDLMSLTERHPRLGIKVLMKLSRMIGRRLIATNEQMSLLKRELAGLQSEEEEASDGG